MGNYQTPTSSMLIASSMLLASPKKSSKAPTQIILISSTDKVCYFEVLKSKILRLFPACLFFRSFPFYSRTKKNLPPSPRKLPIIGNLHQLGSLPHRSLHALSQKHGPLMLIHFGSVATLVASSAKAAEEILKTHDLSLCSRPNLKILNIMLYGCKDIVFSPYGEYWRQIKSVAVLHLLSNTRVKSFQKVREQELGLVIGMLENSSGSLVDISALLFSYSNRISSKVAMGKTYDGSKLIHLLNQVLDMLIVFSVGSYIPWLGWVDQLSGLVGRAKKISKEFDEFLESIIEEHVNSRRGDGSGCQEEQNFIDILLDVQKDKTTGFTFHRDSIKALLLCVIIIAQNLKVEDDDPSLW
ncbi:cytochrome P450 [Artemisia annua]|uniref:Cytochrome P450 n=1 Tax=Artemisia annua TaxID=35608 RepID=A0A2U1LIZ1_ARTAN|nr:cytochrome P450 [Artemisia annua]